MVQTARREGLDGTNRRGFFFKDRRGYAELALAFKGTLTGEHFIEDGAQRKDVAAPVDLLAFDLFWRHVLKRADHGALFADRRTSFSGCQSYRTDRRDDGLSEAEVQ